VVFSDTKEMGRGKGKKFNISPGNYSYKIRNLSTKVLVFY